MKQWKGFFAGVCCTLLTVGLVVTAGAKTGTVMQELTYRDIRVSLDGKVLDLRNAIGEPVEPFMFGGTNYLPVRALAEALGLNVAWNGAEVMVVLTTPEPKPQPESVSAPQAEQQPEPAPAPQTEPEPATKTIVTWDPESAATTIVTLEPKPESELKPETPKEPVSGNREENFDTWDIPENQKTESRYVLNLRSLKIHKPTCHTVPKIAPQDYATSNKSIAELEAEGYTRCGICEPW